jgi:hypothetical protein
LLDVLRRGIMSWIADREFDANVVRSKRRMVNVFVELCGYAEI